MFGINVKELAANLVETLAEGTEMESDDALVKLLRAWLVEDQDFSSLKDEALLLASSLETDFDSMEGSLRRKAEMVEDNYPDFAAKLRSLADEAESLD